MTPGRSLSCRREIQSHWLDLKMRMVVGKFGGQDTYGHPHQNQQNAKYHPDTKIHPYSKPIKIQLPQPTNGATVSCRRLLDWYFCNSCIGSRWSTNSWIWSPSWSRPNPPAEGDIVLSTQRLGNWAVNVLTRLWLVFWFCCLISTK